MIRVRQRNAGVCPRPHGQTGAIEARLRIGPSPQVGRADESLRDADKVAIEHIKRRDVQQRDIMPLHGNREGAVVALELDLGAERQRLDRRQFD